MILIEGSQVAPRAVSFCARDDYPNSFTAYSVLLPNRDIRKASFVIPHDPRIAIIQSETGLGCEPSKCPQGVRARDLSIMASMKPIIDRREEVGPYPNQDRSRTRRRTAAMHLFGLGSRFTCHQLTPPPSRSTYDYHPALRMAIWTPIPIPLRWCYPTTIVGFKISILVDAVD